MRNKCRHTFGNLLLSTFVGQVNSDQTEGRGVMKDHSSWSTVEAAKEAITGEGVMGVGDGDVVMRDFYECGQDDCKAIVVDGRKVYDGWHKKWDTRFDPRNKDPQYKEYIRLRKIYEDR
jgi:hypothetical protein